MVKYLNLGKYSDLHNKYGEKTGVREHGLYVDTFTVDGKFGFIITHARDRRPLGQVRKAQFFDTAAERDAALAKQVKKES